MSRSATPATQNEGGCHEVPRLPLQVARRPGRPSAPKRAARASPVPQEAWPPNQGGCHQVPRLRRKVPRRHWRPSAPKRAQARPSAPPEPAQCHKCHACHAKRRWMSPSATHATRSEGDVTKCHTCHAKYRGVTGDQARPSAPPEPAQCHKCHALPRKRRWMSPSATPATRSEGRCHQVPRLPRKVPLSAVAKCYACHAKMVCERWCARLCVKDGMVKNGV